MVWQWQGGIYIYCHKCGHKNEENARFCVNCGTSLEKKETASSRFWLPFLTLMTVIIFFGVGYLLIQTFAEQKAQQGSGALSTEVAQEEDIISTSNDDEHQQKDTTTIIEESLPKVFTIITDSGYGSGFLYREDGLVITNAHVVAGYIDVIVRNSDGEESYGQVIGISDRSDVALVEVPDYRDTEPLSINVNESSIGTQVIALGSPQGFENSASIGYLTGIDRNIEFHFTYENLYQVDVQIDQGSSGGPLLDAKTGEVIGINSLLYTKNKRFGFSIPMFSVIDLIDSWANSPMTRQEVAGVFGVYDEYYDENLYSYHDDEYIEEYYEDYYYDSEDVSTEYFYDEEYDPYDDYYMEEDSSYSFFDEVILEDFILSFRHHYEQALYYEDFSWIENYLLYGSPAYEELKAYIDQISGEGFVFEFTNNEVINIDTYGSYAFVTTYEQFDFYNNDGEYVPYERMKEYTVVLDSYGNYLIEHIYIYY